jgi:adenine specific DNA methylase Mod
MDNFTLTWDGKLKPVTIHKQNFEIIEGKENRSSNKLFWSDNLKVLEHLVSIDEKIDLVYIDPPFGTGRKFTTKNGEFGYSDPQVCELVKVLYPRLVLIKKVLKKNGNIFVHLDYRASNLVKLILDEIFGVNSFQNQIVWHYKSGGRAQKRYSRKYDNILWYSNGKNGYFNVKNGSVPRDLCQNCGGKLKSSHLKTGKDQNGKLVKTIKSNGKIYNYDPHGEVVLSDIWFDIPHLHQLNPERTGYPTQKPLKLLKRIISAHCPPDGLVADFFAGSGTTLVAAQELNRKWIGSDVGENSIKTIWSRLLNNEFSKKNILYKHSP